MRLRTLLAAVALLPLAALAQGCALTRQHTPEQGYSVGQMLTLQTLNPEAGGTAPVVGLDGKYAEQAMTNYQELPKPNEEAQADDLESLFKVGDN